MQQHVKFLIFSFHFGWQSLELVGAVPGEGVDSLDVNARIQRKSGITLQQLHRHGDTASVPEELAQRIELEVDEQANISRSPTAAASSASLLRREGLAFQTNSSQGKLYELLDAQGSRRRRNCEACGGRRRNCEGVKKPEDEPACGGKVVADDEAESAEADDAKGADDATQSPTPPSPTTEPTVEPTTPSPTKIPDPDDEEAGLGGASSGKSKGPNPIVIAVIALVICVGLGLAFQMTNSSSTPEEEDDET